MVETVGGLMGAWFGLAEKVIHVLGETCVIDLDVLNT